MAKRSELAILPARGHVDAIQLEDSGQVLTIRSWIAPPTNSMGSIDEIVVAPGLPTKGAELTQDFRPDVVRVKAADSFFTGFTIHLRLLTPLQALPTAASLCVAGSSRGQLIVRANDHKAMQCH